MTKQIKNQQPIENVFPLKATVDGSLTAQISWTSLGIYTQEALAYIHNKTPSPYLSNIFYVFSQFKSEGSQFTSSPKSPWLGLGTQPCYNAHSNQVKIVEMQWLTSG